MSSPTTLVTPEVRALVGRKNAWWEPPEPVTRSEVRRFAEATLNPGPLHLDEGYAARSRWGGVVAPPTYVIRPPYGGIAIHGPSARTFRVDIPGAPRGVNAGNEVEVFRPVRVGDIVRQRTRLAEVQEKTGRSGPFVLIVVETVYVDGQGEVLALARQEHIRLPPREGGEERRQPAEGPLPASSVRDGRHAPDVRYGARPLAFDEVEVGTELPPNAYGPVTSEMVVRFSAAVENYEALHHDFLWCREHGFPNVLINGPLKQGLLGTYLAQLAGEEGFVRRLRASHRGMDFPGYELTVRGVVTHKEVGPDGLGSVELDVWVENQAGERTCPGSATLVLPRAGGPPVPTAFPCPRERVAWAFEP